MLQQSPTHFNIKFYWLKRDNQAKTGHYAS